jgi:hypothetical protein
MDDWAAILDEDPAPPRPPGPPPRFFTLKRTAMAAATAFLAINIWTGAPLLALWLGSHMTGRTTLSMGAVFLVVLILGVLVFTMAAAMIWLNNAYDRLTGRPPSGSRRLAWLHSMNTQEEDDVLIGMRVSALERIVVMSVYLAVAAFLVWFFFFAGSPLPGL